MKEKGFAHVLLLILVVGALILFSPTPYWVSSSEFVCLSLDCPKHGLNWGPSLFQRLTTTIINSDSESQKANDTSPESHDDNNTSNWETYTNEMYGFSFQYPQEWDIIDNTETQVNLTTLRNTTQQSTGDYTPGIAWLEISMSEEPVSKIVDEIGNFVTEEKIIINKVDAIKLVGYEGVGGSVYFEKVIIEKDSSNTYVIGLSTQDQDLKPTFIEEFNQILSTFEFLNTVKIKGTVIENKEVLEAGRTIRYLIIKTSTNNKQKIVYYDAGKLDVCVTKNSEVAKTIKSGEEVEVVGNPPSAGVIYTCLSDYDYIKVIN